MGSGASGGTMGMPGGGAPGTLQGCCDHTGVCGAAVQLGNFTGCVTTAEAQAFAKQFGMMGMGTGRLPDGGFIRPGFDGGIKIPPSETIVNDPTCPSASFAMIGAAEAGAAQSCTYKAP
jgi:hypothetical protein